MTKAQRTKIKDTIRRTGIYDFPDGYYILRLSQNPAEYTLRNGITGNTVDVDWNLDKLITLCENTLT